MARGECYTPNPECNFAPNCFSNEHHLYGRAKKQTQQVRLFVLKETVQICAARHREIHHDPDMGLFPMPTLNQIKQIRSDRND